MLTFWVMATLLSQPFAQAQAKPPAQSSQPVATPTHNGLVLEWHVPSLELSNNPAGQTEVRLADFLYDTTPGTAHLPFTSVLVALPGQANPSLEILTIDEHQVDLPGSLAVNPFPSEQVTQPAASNKTPPSQAIELVEIGIQRGVRLARVTLNPVLALNGKLNVVNHLKILIHFTPPAVPIARTADPIIQLIQTQVVNPTQVESTLATTPPVINTAAPAVNPSSPYAIEVDRPGIVQVTYEQLAAAKFPVSTVDPTHLKISLGGQEVALEWTAPQDGTFSPGEAFRFFAQPRFSRWMTNDVYLLSEESAQGAAIQPVSNLIGSPNPAWAEKVVEQNQIYTPDCLSCSPIPLGRDGDRWVWDELSQPGKPSETYSFDLANVEPKTNASLTLWLIGKTDLPAIQDHEVNLTLNGSGLGSVNWNGKTAFNPPFNILAGILRPGKNILTLDVPVMSGVLIDSFWLDGFNIHYQLGNSSMGNEASFSGEASSPNSYQIQLDSIAGLAVYNVTDPFKPVRLTGEMTAVKPNTVTFGDAASPTAQSYQVVNLNGIHNPVNIRELKSLATTGTSGANYIMIAPEGYDQVLKPLVDLRTAQNYSVLIEHLQPIYDQFNEGRLDPAAIRAFLKNAYTTWSIKPAYVLLVGDGTIDPKMYRSTDFTTILPPMLMDVDPYTTDSASDNRFVTLSDDPKQILPDMLIGRLPANSIAEAQVMVNKIVNYETHPAAGSWKSRSMFIADQSFDGYAQRAARLITPGIFNMPSQLFFMKNVMDAALMHSTIMNSWNQGLSLIMYTGHASVLFWSVASFFHITNDLPNLTNGGKLPVVLQMTCFTGTFQMAALSSMDEQLIRKENGGAIAVWGSTSEAQSSGHEYLAKGFLNSLANDPANNPTHILGIATLSGRTYVAKYNPQNAYLIDSFILFGDPLTHVSLDLTPNHGVVLPLVRK